MEKNLKKLHIYKLNHFAIHLKLRQYCKSTIRQKIHLNNFKRIGNRDR